MQIPWPQIEEEAWNHLAVHFQDIWIYMQYSAGFKLEIKKYR